MNMERAAGAARSLPGKKIAAAIIWFVGLGMTAVVVGELAPDVSAAMAFGAAVVMQLLLTLVQSRVWAGRGDLFGYVALFVDSLINFGGVMAVMTNIDNVGSVQAFTASTVGYAGDWPDPLKALLALAASAAIAGLPERLWKD